ncbi:unnamed protein product [Orchesella dallaii]|uniref:SET domain-containing protein n=1 Tax=Orchesella dallaii TaxID=48710 RepID=A0ABP1QSS0_9HEXA
MNGLPGVVKTDEKIGRYLEANRDIKQGEIIITEEALMVGPSGDPHPFKICLGCCRVVIGEPVYCGTCKWPMCSEACEKIALHAKFECRVFKNAGVKPTNDPQDYHNINILRCLMLKEANMKKYETLMKLESGGGDKKKKVVAPKEVAEFILKKCNQKSYDNELLGKMSGIVAINSFATTDRLSLSIAPRMAALLFYNASMMSHDCVPNTSWIRVENPDNTFSIKVWATVPIKSGQLITTQYLDVTRSQIERRAHLQETYNFACSCKRCSDPTELGTFYGAVKCTKCPKGKGYMLSEDPMKASDANWKCNACGNSAPYRECAVPIETNIVEEIRAAADEVELERILDKHADITLHPNHWLMMDCRQEIVKRLFNSIATIKEVPRRVERAQKMLEYCRALHKVTEAFYPGNNRIKARSNLYVQYAEALTKGEGEEVDKELDRIEEVIRKGEEMNLFES